MSTEYQEIFVARQPIFDRERSIRGYELFFRACGKDSCSQIQDQVAATSQVIADGLALGARGLAPDTILGVNFNLRGLLDKLPEALPGGLAIEVPATEDPEQLVKACAPFKDQGHLLVVDGYAGQPGLEPLLEIADFVKIHFADHKPADVVRLRSLLKPYACQLIASKIEDWQTYEGARALGFGYFQGYFFAKPEIVSGRKIPTAQTTRLRLLAALCEEGVELKRLAEIISADPALSYRLLSYINSPAFGLGSEVKSLNHAANLLGLKPLRNWAMVAVVADMDQTERGNELNCGALHRAYFLKSLAEKKYVPGWDPESIFLLGLFSRLDAILDQPMDAILEPLPLSKQLKYALLGAEEDSIAWLTLLDALESSQLENVRNALTRLNLPPNVAASLWMRASRQTAEIVEAN